jgi:hypothetical protein
MTNPPRNGGISGTGQGNPARSPERGAEAEAEAEAEPNLPLDFLLPNLSSPNPAPWVPLIPYVGLDPEPSILPPDEEEADEAEEEDEQMT